MLELSSLTERVNMKLTVKLADLLPVIQRVARAVPARPVEASMGAINIEVAQDSTGSYLATASAFNGEVAITGTFPVQVEGEIVALRPSGLGFLDVIRDLTATDLTLEVESNQIKITSGRGKFKIPQLVPGGSGAASFAKPSDQGVVSASIFSDAVARVALAVSKNNTLPVYASMKLEANADSLRLIGTDRYRLAVIDIPWVRNFSEDKSLLVPLKSIVDLARAHAKSDSIELGFGGTLGSSYGDNILSVFRITAGEFPAYASLLKGETKAVVQFDAQEFHSVLKRVSKFNSEHVRITVSKNNMLVENALAETGDGSEEFAIIYDAEDSFSSAFNPAYLAEAVGSMSGKTTMNFIAADRPLTLVSDNLPNYTHLVMPVNR
jgi:DNA polymerase-3 subunit beta